MCVKTPSAPHRSYGDGTYFLAWNPRKCIKEDPYFCVMMSTEIKYPVLNLNWRAPGPVFRIDVDYLAAVKEEFSLSAAQNIDTLGNLIARESGDLRMAERRVQEITMRQMEPKVRSASALLWNRPTTRDQITQIHTAGALPHFGREPPDVSGIRGLPYDASKTIDMATKIWKDLLEGRVMSVTSHVAGDDAPVISTPTAMVRKRTPGRTLADDYRAISVLRITYLNCEKRNIRKWSSWMYAR